MQQIINAVRDLKTNSVQKHKNLVIVPLIGEDSSLDYLVLSDALKQGFSIKERPDESGGPSVPYLYVSNQTGKNVLAIAGQYVTGGWQNRTLNRNIFFDKVFEGQIPVTCIERGRWHPTPMPVEPEPSPEPEPTLEPTYEPESVPEEEPVGAGTFMASGVVPRSMARSSQAEAWNTIDCCFIRLGEESATSDLSELYKKRQNDFKKFRQHFSLLEKQLGIVAVTSKNGKKLFVADVFDKASTFKSYFDNLIESYILESNLESKAIVDVSEQEAKGFLDSVDSCQFRNIHSVSVGQDIEIKSDNLLGFALLFQGKLVYMNLFTPTDKTSEHERNLETGFGREVF